MTTKFFAKVSMTAALAVAGSMAAMASESQLRANVDFPFQASSANMPAGTYTLENENHGVQKFYLRGPQNHSTMLLGYQTKTSKPTRPHLTFRCSDAGCGLVEITGYSGATFRTTAPKMSGAEKERLVTVYLDRVAGE